MIQNPTDSTFLEQVSKDEDGFAFGATPKLTTTLKRLVRAYPKDIGIIKEFIQNADDAGATCVKIIMDWRHHPASLLPDPKMQVLMGPALLIFNDAVFSDEDLASIQNIGESIKQIDTSKIGRFGLGFNATYNVTDYPSLLTRQYVLFFDPHLNVIPGADYQKPGRGWDLKKKYKGKKAWEIYPDMLNPFGILDSRFRTNQDYFDGTLFRLPLRTEKNFQESLIKQEAFTNADFTFILDQLKHLGAELLLFLKNVSEITVSEIKPDGDSPDFILSIKTVNESHVLENRQKINVAISENPESLLEKLRAGDHELPKVSYMHQIEVVYEGCNEIQEWRITAGLFADENGEILRITETMVNQKEKAFPWAGCAARIKVERNGSKVDEKIDGQVYCLLPLGISTGLPVHINGVFDLDESRKMLTSGEMRGGDENRVRWNKLLVKHCVSRAYEGLIRYLSEDVGVKNIKKFYDFWPDPNQPLPSALSELTTTVYQRLQDKKVLSSAAEDKWKNIRELVFLQKPEGKLQEALLAEKFPLPSPLLPTSIMNGFKQSGINLQFITPQWIRDKYRVTQEVQCDLENAPRPSLRKQEWVVALLQFCLIDFPGKDLNGLPLAILSDKRLHTFGFFHNVAFFASEIERKIFANEPQWFIDPTFANNSGLSSPIPEAGLQNMTVDDVIDNLTAVIPDENDELSWQHDGKEYPNSKWLIILYQYLVEKKSVGSKADVLKKIPLVPDQFSKLWKMGTTSTPLLVPSDINKDLLEALQLLGLPLITGTDGLISAIRDFCRLFPGQFIWHVTGPDLVDLIDANAAKLEEKTKNLDQKILEPILDFLSDEKYYEEYSSNSQIEKLKGFPILFSEDGQILKPNQDNIFISAGQIPPPVAGEIHLVQTGTNDQWRKFIQLLGIQELGRPVLIQRIISGYGDLPREKKVEAFRWIRKNLEAAEEQIEKEESRSAAEELRALVANTPLVICQKGELSPISKVYDPRVEIIQKVLGDNASLPDLIIYKQGERQWLEFFEKLGMAKSPRAGDLLKYLDSLISEAEINGADTVSQRIMAIYDHIRENWEELSRQEVIDGYITYTLQSALYQRAWLPARRFEENLSQFPGYFIPENRLYKSSELHMPRNGHLVASQCAIALITTEPQAKIRDGLGFPDQPAPDDVVKHLKVLLEKWNAPDHASMKEAELETSLRLIYEFIGDQYKNDQITPLVERLRTEFETISCIWDFLDKSKVGKKFWKARYTFKESIPYLVPFRIRISHRSEREGRGFDALGRQDTPLIVDYIDLLNDLLAMFSGQPIDSTIAETVIFALDQISSTSVADEDFSELPVLTRDGCIVKSCEVYDFDAPWWEGKITSNQIHLLDSRVPVKIREQAGIKRLSECVLERPLELPDPINIPEILDQCNYWQQTLRSPQFVKGLERIIIHNHPFNQLKNLQILSLIKSVTITPVEGIQTQLILIDNEKIIGNNEGDYFFDEEENTFFVVVKDEDDLDFVPEFLAQSLNEQLNDLSLSNLSALVKIIDLPPEKIDSTLTRLRIRQLSFQEAIYSPTVEEEDVVISISEEPEVKSEEESITQKIPEDEQKETSHPQQMSDFSSRDAENQPSDGLEVTEDPDQEKLVLDEPFQDVLDETAPIVPVQRQMRSSIRRRLSGATTTPHQKSQGTPFSHENEKSIGESGTDLEKVPSEENTPAKPISSEGSDSLRETISSQKGLSGFEGIRRWPRRKSSSHSRLPHLTISRVFSKMHQEEIEKLQSTDDEIPHNIEVGEAAVKRVMDFEIATGCIVEKMPHNNPGFDVISITPDGTTTKYIEVKGIDGPWTADGVPLSPTQFHFGQRYEKVVGEEFWLYVVEFAKNDELNRVYPIPNPISQVTQYRFDSGWRELAINYKKPFEPEVGIKIKLEDERIGTIIQVNGEGNMLKLLIAFDNGTEERVKYRKSSMVLFQPKD